MSAAVISDPNLGPRTQAAFISMVAFSIIGNTPLAAQPMIIGALVDLLGFSQRQAGLISSAELVGLSIGILVLIPIMKDTRRVWFGLLSLVLILTGNALTAMTSGFLLLVAVRFLSGLGAAAAFCVYLNMASANQNAQRVFATVGACTIFYTSAVNVLAPRLLDHGGFLGLIATLSVFVAIGGLTLGGLRRPKDTGTDQAVLRPERTGNREVFALLLMMLLLYCGHGAVWAYQERIGVAAGLNGRDVGSIMGIGTLLGGLSGSVAARLADMKIGRILPQYISLTASIVAVAILVLVPGQIGFALACGLIAFSWFYGLPYQMGMLAKRDPQGRAALAGLLASTAGMAVGPLAGALLVKEANYWAIGLFAAVCYLVAMVIAASAAKQIDAEVAEQ